MLKRNLTIALLSLALSSGAWASPCDTTAVCAPHSVEAAAPEGYNATENVEGDWTNSTEVNTVQESGVARRMTQEEKARNAAENDSWGGAITIIAMCIVISALIVLSLLFLGFGKISSWLLARKKRQAHGVDAASAEEHHDELDSGEVIAAISMALAEHFGQTHDIEDTILTIKRMKKAYSPWNSKIYNMRQMGPVHHAK